MEDDRLQEFRPYFKRKWAHENTTMGIGLLRTLLKQKFNTNSSGHGFHREVASQTREKLNV